jgi:hypothetical protein
VRFCNLIHGWVLDRLSQNKKTEEAEADIAQWEFSMEQRFPWQSVRETSSPQADREAFLALDQIETH